MRYFGFDLGDGESCVALYADAQTRPAILPVHGWGSFITAVGRFHGQRVIGPLAADNPQTEDLRVCFKRDWRVGDPRTREAIAEFAVGVLRALRDHGSVRHILDEEEVTFVVGCPADWDASDRTRYASLLMEAGLPRVRVVPESRAAYLSAASSGEGAVDRKLLLDCALVIDLGSSTLDLAYVQDGREYAISTMGVQLGGGMLDEMIVEHALDALCSQEEANHIRDILLRKPAWKGRLMLSARKLKEAWFSGGEGEEISIRENIFFEGRHIVDLTLNQEVLEDIIRQPSALLNGESFRSRLLNCLLMARGRVEERLPRVILLTGGASRMSFFQALCRETFPEATFHISASPEFDIARGLACAGQIDDVVEKLRQDVDEYVRSDAVEAHVCAAFPRLADALSKSMTDQLIDQVLLPQYRLWKSGDIPTLGEMENRCIAEAHALFLSPSWENALSETASPWLEGVLTQVQRDLDRLCEKYGIDADRLQIRSARVPTDGLTLPDGLPLPEMPLMDILMNLISALVVAQICGGSGMALIASGPVGWVIGAVIGALASMAAMILGKNAVEKVTRPLIKELRIPVMLRRLMADKHLVGPVAREKMGRALLAALTGPDGLTRDMTNQIAACLDQAILDMTRERGLAIL